MIGKTNLLGSIDGMKRPFASKEVSYGLFGYCRLQQVHRVGGNHQLLVSRNDDNLDL